MYSDIGRPSIPPEQLLRALLLQSLYTVRSERLLMEEIDYSVLFRWFVGLSMDEPIWSPTTFSKNRDRLLQGDIAARVLRCGASARRATAGLLSDEHFTVDGTLLEAWASLKSFRRKDDSADAAAGRSRAIRRSISMGNRGGTTRISPPPIPTRSSRAKGQGKEAKLSYAGHVLLDNRHGLVANVCVDRRHRARPNARRRCCCSATPPHGGDRRRRQGLRRRQLCRRRARARASRRTSRRRSRAVRSTAGPRGMPGTPISQRKRKLIEQVFGWMKTVGGLRKLRHRGGDTRRLDRDLHRGGLQPDPPADAAGEARVTAAGRSSDPATTTEPVAHGDRHAVASHFFIGLLDHTRGRAIHCTI